MFRRFVDYTDKVFGLSNALSQITDTRSASRIPTPSVLWSSFIMHVTRLGSLNALDVELRLPKRVERWVGQDRPSADTIGRVFAKISSTDLRRLHWRHCYQFKRNKVLDTDLPLRAIGLDGHEFFSHPKASMAGFLRTKASNEKRRRGGILLSHGGVQPLKYAD